MMHIERDSFAAELTERPSTLRVVSWNIARGSNLNAVIEFLAAAEADIILLQETDRNARRTSHRNIAREIALKLRLHYVFGCEFEELAQGSRVLPAYTGQATLSRGPLSGCSILRFHKQSGFWRPRWFIPTIGLLQRRRGGRMALVSEVLNPGRTLLAYNLHCESRGSDELRLCQLQEFLDDADRYPLDAPVIAAGDFNFDVSRPPAAAALGRAGFLNPFATLQEPTSCSPTRAERCRIIDWILLRGPLIPANPQVHNSVDASDHYPLSLTVHFSS